jgi:tRNA(Ile2) C34 agmatinyltransferase TiaS
MNHPLAHRAGIAAFFGALYHMGALCPKCESATRPTSKKWAKCKKCGERVERKELPAEPRP